MSEDNKALVRRWFSEVWNNKQSHAIDDMLAADGVVHGLVDDQPMLGTTAFKNFHEIFCGAFPDLHVSVEDLVAENDKVAVRCLVRAKHLGDHLGFKATSAPVDFTGLSIVRISAGKIVEAWNNFDFERMGKQIGAKDVKRSAGNG